MSPEQLLALLPHTALSMALYFFIKREFARFEEDKKKTEEAIGKLTTALADVATRDMLGRMGDRFDQRVMLVEREQAVIQERLRK